MNPRFGFLPEQASNFSGEVDRLLFFLVAVSLFPLGVGPEPQMLRTMAPGALWVCALLASLADSVLDRAADQGLAECGFTLEQLAGSGS